MKKRNQFYLFLLFQVCIAFNKPTNNEGAAKEMPVYKDIPYTQDYSIKYFADQEPITLSKTFMDRNKVIQTLSSDSLLRTHDGQFLYPDKLVHDKTYRPLTDKNISSQTLYQNQFVCIDDTAVFSNSCAGSLFLPHNLPKANILASGSNFNFLISDGNSLEFLSKDRADGRFDYYYGKRWLPSNHVKQISKGYDGFVLVLTDAGLGQLVFEKMTLFDKANYYEQQVRNRHIRLGLNASLDDMDNGNIDSG